MKEKIVKPEEIGRIYRRTPNSFGSMPVEDYNEDELLSFLASEYYKASRWTKPALNATDKSHIFEYGAYTDEYGNGKLIGYITKDKIVFRDKHYNVTKDGMNVYLSEE